MTVIVEAFAENLTPEEEEKIKELADAVASTVKASYSLQCGAWLYRIYRTTDSIVYGIDYDLIFSTLKIPLHGGL